jgi:hypothetical protein
MCIVTYMNSTATNAAHDTHTLSVRGGTVHCDDCREALPTHKDSAPRPGLLAANQCR